ncbi:MAG: formate dehydrogenase accessory sulfurtransferase FdhD [Octadecabacter sp.]|nr:formate dehydrogenase accessory sulfurtransferase FdhD [Octadecabacter sp.]
MTGHRSMPARAIRQGQAVQTLRILAEEVPVALVYNGSTQAVMMATPRDLEDFGRGFTRTEGLGEIEQIEVINHPKGIEVQMWLPEGQADALAARRRAMAGPVGCGLCGIDSLEQAGRSLPAVAADIMITSQDVTRAMAALRDGQLMHDKTRAMHAAGFYVPGQGLTCLREDVGRHNALDKLVGAVPDCTIGAVVLTSRISVDMVQKTALAGASVILAVSAPTTLAVQTSQAANITLAALVRDETFEVFTHPQRITSKETTDVA